MTKRDKISHLIIGIIASLIHVYVMNNYALGLNITWESRILFLYFMIFLVIYIITFKAIYLLIRKVNIKLNRNELGTVISGNIFLSLIGAGILPAKDFSFLFVLTVMIVFFGLITFGIYTLDEIKKLKSKN